MISPQGLRTFACPTYPEIRLAYRPYQKVAGSLDAFEPDCIHIATEGPMGLAARRYCLHRGLDFTTAYHTRFPEYVQARSRLPLALTYRWLRWFHGPARATMVPTPRIQHALEQPSQFSAGTARQFIRRLTPPSAVAFATSLEGCSPCVFLPRCLFSRC